MDSISEVLYDSSKRKLIGAAMLILILKLTEFY
jgi:hypothetical protein